MCGIGSFQDARRKVPSKLPPNEVRSTAQQFQRHSGLNIEPVQEIHKVLGGDIAGSTGCIRATAEPARRTVEYAETHLKRLVNIGNGHSISIVEMHGQLFDREPA